MIKRPVSLQFLVTGVLALGTFSIGLVVYAQWLTSRAFEEHASLVRLTQTVQQDIATAHLWFEEALAGDRSIDLQTDVHGRIASALALIDARLEGRDARLGSADTIPSVHDGLVGIRDDIARLGELVTSRWAGRESTGAIGGAEDQAFDSLFGDILLQSRRVAEDVDRFIEADQTKIFAINGGMLIVLVGLFSALTALIVVNRRAMEERATELEDLVLERTASLARREAEAQKRSEELALARDEARAASEAKSRFLANISHEIRTPMNGVIGMASLLSRTELSDTQREYVETMHSSGLSLLKIINAVLDYSKIEAGKLTLEKVDFQLRSIVDEVLHLFSAEAAREGLVLSSSIDPDVPNELRGDFVRLGQIFSNLVSNAIKFSDGGEIVLACRLSDRGDSEADDVEVLFEVSDQGIGIPQEQLNYLFEQFSQVDETSTRRHGGSGLGLAICKDLAAMMGGRIGVRSEPGEGSTFWFTARFETSDDQLMAAPPVRDHVDTGQGASVQPTTLRWSNLDGKVLVVDDNEINLLVAQRMLEELGLDVDVAADGLEAVDATSKNDYAAILIDSQMPGMDGNEVTRIIRQNEGEAKRTPIIALTANAMEPDREKAFAAGVDDYLSKPVFIEDLEAALIRLLSSPWTQAFDGAVAHGRLDEESDAPVFNADIVEELRGISAPGRSDLFVDLCERFLDQIPAALDEIRAALDAGDREAVRRLAHKLLGVCRQIGAERMARVCDELESIDASATAPEVLREFELLHAEFETTRREMKEHFLD